VEKVRPKGGIAWGAYIRRHGSFSVVGVIPTARDSIQGDLFYGASRDTAVNRKIGVFIVSKYFVDKICGPQRTDGYQARRDVSGPYSHCKGLPGLARPLSRLPTSRGKRASAAISRMKAARWKLLQPLVQGNHLVDEGKGKKGKKKKGKEEKGKKKEKRRFRRISPIGCSRLPESATVTTAGPIIRPNYNFFGLLGGAG